MFHLIQNSLVLINDKKAKYIAHQEFEFSGFLKMMAWLMSGAFKKQSLKNMYAFKKIPESLSS